MARSDLTLQRLEDYKLIVLVVLVMISLLLEVIVHWYLGVEVVYSHFFYIPIVLGAVWYGKRGVFIAFVLGAALLAGTYLTTGAINMDSVLRALMFVVVGLIIGTVADFMKKEQDQIVTELTDGAIQYGIQDQGDTKNIAMVKSRILFFAGVKRLKEKGDVAGLIHALRNRDPAVQYQAVEALGELANPGATDALMRALGGDQYSGIRWKAAEALARIGPPAVPRLIQALGHPDEDVRWKAAITLGEIGDPRGIVPLIGLLSDQDRFVRSRAAYALGLIAQPAIPALSEALSGGSVDVKRGIVAALGKIQDPEAVRVLILTLADPSDAVRQDAITALNAEGEIATKILIDTLNDPEPLRRQGAALVLATSGRNEALKPLKEALETADPQTAIVFQIAIQEIIARKAPIKDEFSITEK
ncbi:MAG: HEAT repeat domain-containing protein [Methanoregulaceae archaeon]|nr:HEAT repeat domain-containing protein [Methanoregulaceae archaeon]